MVQDESHLSKPMEHTWRKWWTSLQMKIDVFDPSLSVVIGERCKNSLAFAKSESTGKTGYRTDVTADLQKQPRYGSVGGSFHSRAVGTCIKVALRQINLRNCGSNTWIFICNEVHHFLPLYAFGLLRWDLFRNSLSARPSATSVCWTDRKSWDVLI